MSVKTITKKRQSSILAENRRWLKEQMNPYFFIAMKDEPLAMDILTREIETLKNNRQLVLADREKSLIIAAPNVPGSLYETLSRFPEREISYALIAHSDSAMPGMEQTLEIQRFEFDRKNNKEITERADVIVPTSIKRSIARELAKNYPDFMRKDMDRLLRILWLNNEKYVCISPPSRVAQLVQLFGSGNLNNGLYLDVEPMESGQETRVLFAVANPPQNDFLLQVMEVFNRLDLGINRAYCLTISNGIHPYFLGTFYIRRRDGGIVPRGSEVFSRLQQELYNTQVLSTRSQAYREFVVKGVMSGMDDTLVNAFIAFCHTNLAHCQPDRFGLDDVKAAFHANPDISLHLAGLFRRRFDPIALSRTDAWGGLLQEAGRSIDAYNTGHGYLDGVRRSIFRCCLLFIRHTLKTNFFVLEKQAISFRLDPAYLAELGAEFTSDLPAATPFRVTFFYSRSGFGYHIGFSDIARGGWRTVIARTADDYITNANVLFRENFVLAHTQHLKNKDIYEGGSKMVVLLDSSDPVLSVERDMETWRLYKLQYGMINAFLDIFVTRNGVVSHPRVVDYYREDEPIELGPDENMHDTMVEEIARLSRRRGYILGIGIISSKRVGINHKEYGVTSLGVVTFAEITMAEIGIDVRKDPFSVKLTGGPNGDVAGNAMRLLLERCPGVQIRMVLDGTAALCDPLGADHSELLRLLLSHDLESFDPDCLHVGAFMLFQSGNRQDGLRKLYRRVVMTDNGLREEWISVDEFSHEFGSLVFSIQADLFIPAGGRPETINSGNWERFLLSDGTPSSRVIVEGANSFITPEARVHLQRKGVLIMRDSSANKCGVISSSYEIIANLIFNEHEFLEHKERYVRDVMHILETMSEWEARLILSRRRENPALLCTEISDAISNDINGHYTRIFKFFQAHPDLCLKPFYRRAIIGHLPHLIQNDEAYRRRITRLPLKYLYAILSAEIGSSMVYRGNQETAFEDEVRLHINRKYPPRAILPLGA